MISKSMNAANCRARSPLSTAVDTAHDRVDRPVRSLGGFVKRWFDRRHTLPLAAFAIMLTVPAAHAAQPQIVNVNTGCDALSVNTSAANLRVQLAGPGAYRFTLTGPSGTVANHVFFDQAQMVDMQSGSTAQLSVPIGGTFHLTVRWANDPPNSRWVANWPAPITITHVVVSQNGHRACVPANSNPPPNPHATVRPLPIAPMRR
jgi:hypothetical protein